MKANIHLQLKDGILRIPEKYQFFLSQDLDNILNIDSSCYSFSQLFNTMRLESGEYVPRSETVWFEISSISLPTFNAIIKHIMCNESSMVDNTLLFSHIEMIDECFDECVNGYAYFSSTSPITIYDKIDDIRYYYIPSDSDSSKYMDGAHYKIIRDTKLCEEKIKNSLLSNLYTNNIFIDENSLKIELIQSFKIKNYTAKIDYNNKIIRTIGFFGYFKIYATPKLLEIVSNMGIGNAIGLGFGHLKRNK